MEVGKEFQEIVYFKEADKHLIDWAKSQGEINSVIIKALRFYYMDSRADKEISNNVLFRELQKAQAALDEIKVTLKELPAIAQPLNAPHQNKAEAFKPLDLPTDKNEAETFKPLNLSMDLDDFG